VVGVDPSDFLILTSGSVVVASSIVTGSGDTYLVTIPVSSGTGNIGVELVDDDSIVDAALNKLGGSGIGNGDDFVPDFYRIDREPPRVASIVINNGSLQRSMIDSIKVTFSEKVVAKGSLRNWPNSTSLNLSYRVISPLIPESG
jgi:hypothetical protein